MLNLWLCRRYRSIVLITFHWSFSTEAHGYFFFVVLLSFDLHHSISDLVDILGLFSAKMAL